MRSSISGPSWRKRSSRSRRLSAASEPRTEGSAPGSGVGPFTEMRRADLGKSVGRGGGGSGGGAGLAVVVVVSIVAGAAAGATVSLLPEQPIAVGPSETAGARSRSYGGRRTPRGARCSRAGGRRVADDCLARDQPSSPRHARAAVCRHAPGREWSGGGHASVDKQSVPDEAQARARAGSSRTGKGAASARDRQKVRPLSAPNGPGARLGPARALPGGRPAAAACQVGSPQPRRLRGPHRGEQVRAHQLFPAPPARRRLVASARPAPRPRAPHADPGTPTRRPVYQSDREEGAWGDCRAADDPGSRSRARVTASHGRDRFRDRRFRCAARARVLRPPRSTTCPVSVVRTRAAG